MELLDTDVAKFQKLYCTSFGVELDYQSAHAKLSMLVRQAELVYKPITRKQLNALRITKDEDEKRENDDVRMAQVANQE